MKTFTPDSLIIATRQELVDIVTDQAQQIKLAAEQNNNLSNDITELKMQLDWLKRQVFGTKSERFVPSDDVQLAIELNIVNKNENDEPQAITTVNYTKKSSNIKPLQGHGRGSMPTHLPIKDKIIEPDGDISAMIRIGEEVSWHYEVDIPSLLHIVRTTRPKYALPQKDGVVIGILPALPIEKGNAGPGLIAQIINDKYIYHLPLDRQRKKFNTEYQVSFSESWLSDNVGNGVFWLEPVYNEYVKRLLSSNYIQADETPIPVLTKDGRGKTHKGYFWVYHDPIQKIVIFDYRDSRSSKGPSEFLKNFNGTLQVDGYEGYAEIINRNGLKHAACMDHVRRRFEKALEYDRERAAHAIDTMQIWYNLEREAREKDLTFDEHLTMRKEKVAASMDTFKQWMQQQLLQVLPKSPIGIALQYALNQWEFFTPYLSDGRVELSNILIENAIRPVALGRKNFLFAGSHAAAKWPAVIYSLAATATYHGAIPFNYFKELLTELPNATNKELHKYLLPEWESDRADAQ